MEKVDTKKYTEKQLAFVDALFGEAGGNVTLAKRMAGYSENSANMYVLKPVQELIVERAEATLAMHAASAVTGITGLISDPIQPGAKVKLAAAKEILDRIGVVKIDKVQHSAEGDNNLVFVLPAKIPVDKHEDNEV